MSRSFPFRVAARALIGVLYAQSIWAAAPPPRPAAARPAPAASAVAAVAAHTGSGSGTTIPTTPLFGPARFTRTHGLFPDCFVQTFTVPSWVKSPYKVRILNGAPNGANRVHLAAYVEIDDRPVVGFLDFLFSGHTIERWITLTPGKTTKVKVVMWSLPGSYITLSTLGTNGDTQPPAITVTAPGQDAVLSDPTPDLAVTYSDAAPVGQAASGIDTSTFRATLDGFDRTGLFSTSTGTANATIPASLALADGQHMLRVEIRDRAGNKSQHDRPFTIRTVVDPPSITLTAPAEGSLVAASPVTLTGTVTEHAGGAVAVRCRLGASSVDAQVSGGQFTCAVPLEEGENAIEVSATDSRNQTVQATRIVRLDTIAPALAITAPADNSVSAETSIAVTGTVADESAVTVTVNGQPATVTDGQFTLPSIAIGDGPTFPITAVATDAAGHQSQATVTVRVLRNPLTVNITSPVDGAVLRGPVVPVQGTTTQDVGATVDVNGEQATVQNGQFTAQVSLLEGTQTLRATARDAAGRTATHEVAVRIDTIAPSVTITEPAAGLVTNASAIRVAGTVTDPSTSTLTINGTDVPLTDGAFSHEVPLAGEGPVTFTIVATDSANNTVTRTVDIVVDRTAPTLTIAGPTPNEVMSGLPIVVQGTVTDATATTVTVDGTAAERTLEAWLASFATLPDGPHTFNVTAADAAGNTTTKQVTAILDTGAPAITITSPTEGALTRFDTIDVTGTVQDASAVTVQVAGRPATVTGGTFTATAVPIAKGDVRLFAVATDETGRTSQTSVLVTRDSDAPEVDLAAPERITRRETGRAVATVTDNLGIAQVVFAVQGEHVATQTAGPFGIDLSVPEASALGGTFVVTATVTDRAGNVTTATKGVRVAADGAVVGQVLSDATGLPLPGAKVYSGSETRTADAQGRYTLPSEQASTAVRIEHENMTSVARVVGATTGAGSVPVDARLTPLAAASPIGAAGGTLTAAITDVVITRESGNTAPLPSTPGPIATLAIDVPAGAVASDTPFQLTPLSPQGLPELLPLGWSPLTAFDLRTGASVQGELNLRVTFADPAQVPPGSVLTLVQHRPLQHAWVVVARDVTVSEARLASASLSGTGAFAFVVPDVQDPPVVVPAIGEPITGVPVRELPLTATSRGLVEPDVIPPSGGVVRGQLRVDSPTTLPSGTLVQAEIGETFTLPSGQVASEEMRRADIVLYQSPRRALSNGSASTPPPADVTSLGAAFPIAPSRVFNGGELVEGRVHLDILAGRESVRGVVGGREPATVNAGDARLVVPGDALGEDTAIALTRASFSAFLPTHAALTPLAELVVDVAGRALTRAAELSIAAPAGGPSGGTFVIARVERVEGVPAMQVVAGAELAGDRLVARAIAGLPGVTLGGRYVFYRVDGALAYVSGVVSGAGEGVASIVAGDALPFIARSAADGSYLLVTLAGSSIVRARVPFTSLETQDSVTVAAGETATLNLSLSAAVTNASVTPANGTRAVARQAQIAIASTVTIDPASVASATITLAKVAGTTVTPVAIRTVLAGSGQTLAIVPNALLDSDSDYRLEAAGLMSVHGGVIAVAPSTFHTAVDTAPTYSTDALTFSFPDANGVVTMSATAGSFPLGAKFLVINSTSGEVASFGTRNDGSVSETVSASLNDRFVITITDPDGRVTTLTRSQFVDPATGRTAIGPGGGVVTGPGGVGLRLPEGAVSNAVVLKVSPLNADAFPVMPEMPGASFGSGLQVDATGDTTFTKEVDLVFPVPPAALAAAQAAGQSPDTIPFYVFRRVMADDGQPIFMTLDTAKVEGTGDDMRVVTQSFPFAGLIGSVALVHALVLYALPGLPTTGSITGQVLQPVFDPGAATPRYVGVPNAVVMGVDASGNPLEPRTGTTTNSEGWYSLLDHRFTSGQVQVQTTYAGETVTQAIEVVQRTDTKAMANPGLAALFKNLFLKQFGTANLTLSPAQPAPPAPMLTLRVMKTVEGKRVDTRGLVVSGTPLVIGVSDTSAQPAEIRSLTVKRPGASGEGDPLSIEADPALQQSPRDPLAMDVATSESFIVTEPGAYTLEATALPAFGPPVRASVTFRVLAGGGGVDTDNNAAPAVITAQTVPRANAIGVAVSVFPQIAFTEPVRNIPDNVKLFDQSGTEVPIRIGGVGIGPDGQPTVVENVTNVATVVTALTLEPLYGLSYGKRYRIALSADISDLDVDTEGAPANKQLEAFESAFTTFGPESVGGTDETFASPGLALIGDRAYVLESRYSGGVGGSQRGWLHVYDASNPVALEKIGPGTEIGAAPRDIAGEEQTVAVVTTPITVFAPGVGTSVDIASGPSNILIYSVAGPTPSLVGAASLTTNIMEGVANRVVVKDQVAYVATARKGIQVVDFSRAATDLGSKAGWIMHRDLFAPGASVNPHAVVATIPVKETPSAQTPAWLGDLEVGDAVVEGSSQRLVFTTGFPAAVGLAIVNPATSQIVWQGEVATIEGTLTRGEAVTLAQIDGRQLALVGGTGQFQSSGSTGVLGIVDLSPLTGSPRQAPKTIGWVTLPHAVGDIVVFDRVAVVSSAPGNIGGTNQGVATIVSLADPQRPVIVGTLTGVGSRMALTADGMLLSTDRQLLQQSASALGGLRTTTFTRRLVLRNLTKTIPITEGGKTAVAADLEYRVIPAEPLATTAKVRVFQNSGLLHELPSGFDGAKGTAQWPSGVTIAEGQRYFAQVTTDEGTETQLISALVPLPVTDISIEWDDEHKAFVAQTASGRTIIEDTWDGSGKGLEPPINGYDYKNSTRRFAKAVRTDRGVAPDLPSDYMLLKIHAGGTLVWSETNNETLRVEVLETGKIEAELKATKELGPLSVQKIVITAEYYASSTASAPLKLKPDYVLIANERLHGRLYDLAAAAVGRGEGAEGAVTELVVGMIPFAGDGAGIVGEAINFFDPSVEVSRVNLALSIIGIASEFTQITGPVGVALDKGIVFLRVGLKRIVNVVTGPLARLPGIVYEAAKARNWDALAELAEGSLKASMVAGGEFMGRVVREDEDLDALNTVVKRYSDDVMDLSFVEKLKTWDELYGDPDAVRSAIRVLADVKNAAGESIRLTNDAAEGAVKFMARAGNNLPASEREELLRLFIQTNATDDIDAMLRFVKSAPDNAPVEGLARFLDDARRLPCEVP